MNLELLNYLKEEEEHLTKRLLKNKMMQMAMDIEMEAYGNQAEKQVVDCILSDEELDEHINRATNGTAQEEES